MAIPDLPQLHPCPSTPVTDTASAPVPRTPRSQGPAASYPPAAPPVASPQSEQSPPPHLRPQAPSTAAQLKTSAASVSTPSPHWQPPPSDFRHSRLPRHRPSLHCSTYLQSPGLYFVRRPPGPRSWHSQLGPAASCDPSCTPHR